MTANSIRAYNFLKENHGEKFTISEVQKALDIKGVAGCYNAQFKKGNVDRILETITTEDGKSKDVIFWTITEQGMAFDPEAPVED